MELLIACTRLALTRLTNSYPAPIRFAVVTAVCEWLNDLIGFTDSLSVFKTQLSDRNPRGGGGFR